MLGRRAILLALAFPLNANASLESKNWPASEEARQFVKGTVVIGFLASAYDDDGYMANAFNKGDRPLSSAVDTHGMECDRAVWNSCF